MSTNLVIKEGDGNSSAKLAAERVGSFSETSPRDSAHIAKMTNSGDGWSTFFSYDNGTYTCKKACNCIVTGWVTHYAASSYTQGRGQLWVNGIQQCSYQTPSKASGSTSAHYGVLRKFKVGDTFYFRTPTDDGCPKQLGELYVLSDKEYDRYSSLINTQSTITITAHTLISSSATVKKV